MWLRRKIYKGNQQALRLIVEKKMIQALMTKHFIQSFSESLLFFSNNNIVTQWVTTKIEIKCIPPKFIIYLFQIFTNLAPLLV
jgi:hypothetical protein